MKVPLFSTKRNYITSQELALYQGSFSNFPKYLKDCLAYIMLVNGIYMTHLQNEYFEGYKQAHRRQDDMAIVNAGMRVLLEDKGDVIKELSLSYGGMDARTVMVTNTAGNLVGK